MIWTRHSITTDNPGAVFFPFLVCLSLSPALLLSIPCHTFTPIDSQQSTRLTKLIWNLSKIREKGSNLIWVSSRGDRRVREEKGRGKKKMRKKSRKRKNGRLGNKITTCLHFLSCFAYLLASLRLHVSIESLSPLVSRRNPFRYSFGQMITDSESKPEEEFPT